MAAMSLRRNRDNRHIRELTREVRLHVEQFIQPLFVGGRPARTRSGAGSR